MPRPYGTHLYVLSAPGWTKVGRSKHCQKRLAEIQSHFPWLSLELVGEWAAQGHQEPALHRQLGSVYEKCAEWYRAPADEVLALVACQLAELDKV